MELDELKLQLKQKLEISNDQKSPTDIAQLLTKKTNSIIHKLKKSLWFEIVSCILFTVAFIYIGLTSKYQSFQLYFSSFAILCLAFLILLIYLLKKVNTINHNSMPIKENLVAIHSLLKEFSKRYFQFTMSLIPICVFFAGYLGYMDGKSGIIMDEITNFSNQLPTSKQAIVFLIVYLIVLSVGIYYFTKWYIKKLYGLYLDQLQSCINDLE